MLVTLIRLTLLYALLLSCMRLMGRRQIGELQPSELVITMLLSEIAAIPLANNDVPLLNAVVSILVLASLEIMLSVLSLKCDGIRRLLQGNPKPVVRSGTPDQATLRELRLTVDDLLEALREKDVFDLRDVRYAILEANGKLTLQRNSEPQQPSVVPCPVVCDGKAQAENFSYCGMTDERLRSILRQLGMELSDVFLLTVDENSVIQVIRKERRDA